MFEITVSGRCRKQFMKKILLSDALEQMGIFQHKPCGGNGTCGKCRVLANGKEVLSCRTFVSEDTEVVLLAEYGEIRGVTKGYTAEFEKKPLVSEGYGMAIDIGTTTVAGYLYHFPEGELIKSICVANRQAEFGADVISRIGYAEQGGIEVLKNRIQEQIAKISEGYPIEKYVITGNTTMLHLLTGKNPAGIARAPFLPESLFGEWVLNAYLPKCISAYVGADITTAILASGMMEKKTAFLVDIGTNGEMALWHNGELVCCSTAAGPAFEGAGIYQGVPAVRGAINRVFLQDNSLQYETVDGGKPVGICGTGIMDAAACMLELGALDETGYLEENFSIGDSKIVITPEDIRAIQLAKAAIAAGIDTLLHACGIEADAVEAFYIAGGFGSYIRCDSAVRIGLIPEAVAKKVVAIGNAAGNGAAMILQSTDCLKKSEEIAKTARTVDLSQDAYFMERYMEQMMFEMR